MSDRAVNFGGGAVDVDDGGGSGMRGGVEMR